MILIYVQSLETQLVPMVLNELVAIVLGHHKQALHFLVVVRVVSGWIRVLHLHLELLNELIHL